MRHRFATLDVFTDRRFAGNPLAVVFDADAIDETAMQAVAREFGHPETVFVLRAAQAGSTARVRIFTPATEMPFAGHPTVGTAVVLSLGAVDMTSVVLEEKIGLVRCSVSRIDATRGRAHFAIPALPREDRPAASAGTLAAALRLAENDLGFGPFRPERWSAGNVFTFVPVRGIEAIRRCGIDAAHWAAAFEARGRSSAFVFCAEASAAGNDFHARMFAPGLGVPEDPATGSAVATFAGYYTKTLRPADGEHRLRIEQGYEMGRPSLIELGLSISSGKLVGATVGGEAIVVTEGTIVIQPQEPFASQEQVSTGEETR